ncbi:MULTISPECIES: L,D-transpeptidase [Rhizobium]|uniref:Murein L,D-transpeptidase n=1 Tax=Rhizobium tropici TaxID=398 RepID=A0A329Y9Y8_RHITR|nr:MULTISPECIES: L,D-transpeptidase [Rhizobium]MBB3405901.1 lipoprotein-anchoring transpeptidase ErfK/SrfK [Rhizobium sp. BK289]MBB3418459.1 lipoprotein-anchoring transpeptidase ErfK/SrfK [Rhizobium sp. BK284]MDK4718907.1 L,D-transpeptidase [Rhizobium sp. CNPSo 3968]RAX38754.1 murein L,D-transpeptidase [Rhizobium tropici]
MIHIRCLAISIALIFSSPAVAAPIAAQDVNGAAITSIQTEAPGKKPSKPDAAIIKLQVLLDRAGSSPGAVDGYAGENLSKAIAGFEALQRLPIDGKLDPEVLRRIEDQLPVIQPYVITSDDGKDLVKSIPKDYGEQAKMDRLGYTSIGEKLAERFHMSIALLKALNPTASFTSGETIMVAMPGEAKTGVVKRIEVHRKLGQVFAFAEDGSLLTIYPATIGSEESPSPSGSHKVKGVARLPTYTYNPKINFQQGRNKRILKLPSGPNNPVGTVWIDLTEPTYGIHGTPDPELIGKVGSHGCVRLTNWDVEELARMVKPGVIVEFVD